jgi:hypothetical protein
VASAARLGPPQSGAWRGVPPPGAWVKATPRLFFGRPRAAVDMYGNAMVGGGAGTDGGGGGAQAQGGGRSLVPKLADASRDAAGQRVQKARRGGVGHAACRGSPAPCARLRCAR